ncbi:MAG: ParB N-terminal domain-containing protein [Lentisphaerae bacterium]|nr:ParB N-terminal domain-containing protein [Lentisphaerota bacterium]
MNMELVNIDVANVTVKRQLREEMGDLITLESSIRKLGLICPIIIDKNNALVSGSRRLQACSNIGLTTIPAFRLNISFDSMTALEIQSDENLCRLPLSTGDLECLIQRKKAGIGDSQVGLMSRFKHLFTRKAVANK